jgi:hypothetical protein
MPVLRRQIQEDCKFDTSEGYIVSSKSPELIDLVPKTQELRMWHSVVMLD